MAMGTPLTTHVRPGATHQWQCAAALEHLAAYRFRELADAQEEEEEAQAAMAAGLAPPGGISSSRRVALSKLGEEPKLFASQLDTLLHMIVFEECTNQWSLSRPLLALILICDDAYNAWKDQALASMAAHPQRQQKLALAFDKLLQDVPRGKQANLDVKTRDRFTQNLTQFRHDVRSLV